jgi:MFS transporter, DHA2 family, multidrug resistance protein
MNNTAPPLATRREWIGLAVIALPCLVYAMDMTVLNLAVPAISAELKPTASQLLWIIDIYGFLVAGFLITMGPLGDRIGRRKLLFPDNSTRGLAMLVASTLVISLGMAPVFTIGNEMIITAARGAFFDATQMAAAVGLVIVLLACAVTARILRGGRGAVKVSGTAAAESASGRSPS